MKTRTKEEVTASMDGALISACESYGRAALSSSGGFAVAGQPAVDSTELRAVADIWWRYNVLVNGMEGDLRAFEPIEGRTE